MCVCVLGGDYIAIYCVNFSINDSSIVAYNSPPSTTTFKLYLHTYYSILYSAMLEEEDGLTLWFKFPHLSIMVAHWNFSATV